MDAKEKIIGKLAGYFRRRLDNTVSEEDAESEVRTYYSILEGFDSSFTVEQKERILTKYLRDRFSKDWYGASSEMVLPMESAVKAGVALPADCVDAQVGEYHRAVTDLLEKHLLRLAEEEKGVRDYYLPKLPSYPSGCSMKSTVMEVLFDRSIATRDDIASNLRRGQKRFLDDVLSKMEKESMIVKLRAR